MKHLSILALLAFAMFISTSVVAFAQDANTSGETEINMQMVATKTQMSITDTPADVTVITADDLKASGSTSVTEILREYGVAAMEAGGTRKDGSNVYVQGMDSDRLLILVDGQRVRLDRYGNISVLRRIPVTSIESIEIVKGPSSVLWGSDAQAGVIYIKTKRGEGAGQGLHGSVGSSYKNNFYLDDNNHLTQTHLNLSYGWDGGRAWGGGSFEYGYGWESAYTLTSSVDKYGNIQNFKILNEREDYANFDVHGGVNFDIGEKHNLEVSGMFQREVSPITVDNEQDNLMFKALGNIVYNWYVLDNLDLRLSTGLNYDYEKRIAFDVPAEEIYIFSDTELFAAYYLNDIFTIKGGYNVDFQYLDNPTRSDESGEKYSHQNHALFAATDMNFELGDVDLNIMAGFRGLVSARWSDTLDSADPLWAISPEVGVLVKPIDMLAIRVNAGHSYKVPKLNEALSGIPWSHGGMFYLIGNPDLKPESSWGYSAEVEVYPIKNMSVSAGVFFNDITDMIVSENTEELYDGSIGELYLYTYDNIDKAYTFGVNASTKASFLFDVFGELNYLVNFEYLISARQVLEDEDLYFNKVTGKYFAPRLTNRPEFTVSGSIGWYKEKWGTSAKISGFYYGEGYRYSGSDTSGYTEYRTPAWTSLDLYISQELPKFSVSSKEVETLVYFEVKNLLDSVCDTDYDTSSGIATPDGDSDYEERRFVIGFNMTF